MMTSHEMLCVCVCVAPLKFFFCLQVRKFVCFFIYNCHTLSKVKQLTGWNNLTYVILEQNNTDVKLIITQKKNIFMFWITALLCATFREGLAQLEEQLHLRSVDLGFKSLGEYKNMLRSSEIKRGKTLCYSCNCCNTWATNIWLFCLFILILYPFWFWNIIHPKALFSFLSKIFSSVG